MYALKQFVIRYRWILLIFIILAILRFLFIDRFPPGLQFDETMYGLSGKTFAMMGRDISGTSFPQTLFFTKTPGEISPVPYILLAPFWTLLPMTPSVFHFFYVCINMIAAIAFALLLYRLFGNKQLALVGSILFLLNPWSFLYSRTGMDGPVVLLFYMLGIYFLLGSANKKNLISSFIFLTLTCFSYHGAKINLIPLVVITLIYLFKKHRSTKSERNSYFWFLGSLVVVLFSFVAVGFLYSGSILKERAHELVFSNPNYFSGIVNSLRTASIQTPIHPLMINKFNFVIQHFIEGYFAAFSPSNLFIKAEVLEFHGFYYFFEVFFFVWGFIALYKNQKKIFWYITSLTLVAPLATASSLAGFSILNRSILLLPLLLIYILYGIFDFHKYTSQFLPKKIISIFLVILYGLGFVYFQYVYFFILPVQLNMMYRVNTRVLTKYLLTEKNYSKKIIVITSQPEYFFSGFLSYLPKNQQEYLLKQKQTFGNLLDNSTYYFDNIQITSDCIKNFEKNTTYIVNHDKAICYKKIPANYKIVDLKDAGTDFYIVNGSMCQNYVLSGWRYPHLLSDFAIEGMNSKKFCERWISGTK